MTENLQTAGERRRSQLAFLALVLVIGIGGVIAAQVHKKRVGKLVFTTPISTSLTISGPDEIHLRYRAYAIAGRPVLDLGHLRVIAPSTTKSRGSSSGGFTVYRKLEGRPVEQQIVRSSRVKISRTGKEVFVQFSGASFTFEETTVSIGGQQFDFADRKIIALAENDTISEVQDAP